MIENIVLCVFGTVMYWGICQLFATYDHRCLSRELYVNVKNKYLWLLLGGRYRGRRKMPEEDWYKLNILGLATYIALLPVLLAYYVAIFNVYTFDGDSGRALAYYSFLIVFLNVFDDILGKMFYRTCSEKEQQQWRSPGIPNKILWNGMEPEELKYHAEKVFRAPDKIIWDVDVQEYYYIQGKILLRLRANGTFISMTPDADSPCVLKAMRTGRFIKS